MSKNKNTDGLNPNQIRAINLGLTRDDLTGHNWSGFNGDQTLSYLSQRPEDVTVQQAMDYIRGLGTDEISAITLGLTRDDLIGHNWSDPLTPYYALDYLRNRPEDVTVQQAMDNIRGLGTYEISAITLGLTRDDLTGHNWSDDLTADRTISYLKNRPEDVTVQQAMDNIRGLPNDGIVDIMNAQRQGIALGLTPLQVYIRRFDMSQCDAISEKLRSTQNPNLQVIYHTIMPNAAEAILEIESRAALKHGAAQGFISSTIKKDEDLGSVVGEFLTNEDGARLAQVNKATSNTSKELQTRFKAVAANKLNEAHGEEKDPGRS